MRVNANFTVKNAVWCRRRHAHTVNLTVILTWSEAALTWRTHERNARRGKGIWKARVLAGMAPACPHGLQSQGLGLARRWFSKCVCGKVRFVNYYYYGMVWFSVQQQWSLDSTKLVELVIAKQGCGLW